MNKLLIRIWAGIFISIVITSALGSAIYARFFGVFFVDADWYTVKGTVYLVQKIIDRTPLEKIETERVYLSQLLEREIRIYTADDDAFSDITKHSHNDGKTVYTADIEGKDYFCAPARNGALVVAIAQSLHLYRPPSSKKIIDFKQFIWIFILTSAGGMLLARSINSRLNELEAAAEKIHRGDFSVRVEGISNDLIGNVGSCFNEMANRIQSMVSSQQKLLSGFVSKLRTALDTMTHYLDALSEPTGVSNKSGAAKKIYTVIDDIELFINELLSKEKNDGQPSTAELVDLPAAGRVTGNQGGAPGEKIDRDRSTIKTALLKRGISKFVARLAIGILIILLSNHFYWLLGSQVLYKYQPGIQNWYPCRTIPALIQRVVDIDNTEDVAPLLDELRMHLQREIDLLPTQSMFPGDDGSPITAGVNIQYGAFNEQPVYFAPVRSGNDTLVIDSAIHLYRHRPSLMIHLCNIPLEFLLTIIGSVFLSWPVIRNLKLLENGLNRIREGDLETRIGLSAGKPVGNLARSLNDMVARTKLLITNRRHLVQAVAHEIRNPAYRIHFHLEMMLQDKDMESITRRIENIREEIEEMGGLADELQTFTDIEDRRLEDRGIRIRKELLRIVDHYKKTTPHLSITLAGTPNDTSTICAHPIYFRRVVQNILSNAVRHTHSRISIKHGRAGSKAFIEICDDGPGIPPQDREAVFEPFARLDSSRNRKTGGYGLGLAITRRILSLYHGSIFVSDNIPRGAKFTIYWPTDTPSSAA